MGSRGKGPYRRLFWALFLLTAVVGLALGLRYMWVKTPKVLSWSASTLAGLGGVANFAMEIEKLGLDEAIIRDIRAGVDGWSGLKVSEVMVLRSGSQAQSSELVVSGLELTLVESGGRVFIPGISMRQGNPSLDVDASADAAGIAERIRLPSFLSRLVKPSARIEVRDSLVHYVRISGDVESRVTVNLSISGTIHADGEYRLEVEGGSLKGHPPALAGMSCEDFRFRLVSEGRLYPDRPCEDIFARFEASATSIQVKAGNNVVTVPSLDLEGGIYQNASSFDGHLSARLADTSFVGKAFGIRKISGEAGLKFALDKAFRWGCDAEGPRRAGSVSLGAILLNNRDLGALDFDITQDGGKLKLEGEASWKVVKGRGGESGTHVNGELALPGAGEGFSLTGGARMINSRFDAGAFVKALDGMVFEGGCSASFGYRKSDGKPLVSLSAEVGESSLSDKARGLEVSGLNIDLEFPDLLHMRTAPQQRLAFKWLKYKDLDFGEADIRFQLESSRLLFVERSSVEWCGGNMDFGAVRVDFTKPEDVDFTFFCDRIKVAEFLRQLKVADASGEGRVAGRIPVSFIGGRLVIRNGYLYSTPGHGGRIHLKDFAGSELAGTSIQMAIAREALRDYSYEWVRMHFNTMSDNLFIRLELDGAPSDLLPFTYDEVTVLRPSGEGDMKARFQGISFDINFKVPMDEIIHYGRRAGSLFK